MANVTIVVDVLNGFCKAGNLASPRCDAAIPRIRDVIEERRRVGDQLIFLADTHDPNDREFEVFPVHCVRGTKEADVVVVEGRPCAKTGRRYRPNPRLELVS